MCYIPLNTKVTGGGPMSQVRPTPVESLAGTTEGCLSFVFSLFLSLSSVAKLRRRRPKLLRAILAPQGRVNSAESRAVRSRKK